MMVMIPPLNEQQYDQSATDIVYCKLFPMMVKDFLLRGDASQLVTGNLTSPAGPVTAGPYLGNYEMSIAAKILEQIRRLQKELGSMSVELPYTLAEAMAKAGL